MFNSVFFEINLRDKRNDSFKQVNINNRRAG